MRNADAQPVIRTLLQHHTEARPWRTEPFSVPATDYTDAGMLAREWAMLAQRPQLMALSADVPDPGSFIRRDVGGLPLVITRGDDGCVHALANVCAHRGSQVVTADRGSRRRLTCPYHGWSYALDGTHVGLPDAASFPTVTTPGPGLRPVPAVEQHGLIWVTPNLHAPDPDPAIGSLADDFDHYCLDRHRHWRAHQFDLPMNWKLVIDTFLEPYHFASLHKNTVGPLFIPNLCVAEAVGLHLREVLPRRSLVELADDDPATWDVVPHSAIVYVLFPNAVFVMQIDHVETWRVHPHPTDPGRSVCDLDFYIPEPSGDDDSGSAERHWERNWQLTIDTVSDEDFWAMAGVQRGLTSGALERLTFGANEPALSLFHRALALARPAEA